MRQRGCERWLRAGTESRQGGRHGDKAAAAAGRLGRLDWLGESGPGGRRSLAAVAVGRAGRSSAGGHGHLPVLEPGERCPGLGRRAGAARGRELGRQSWAGMAPLSSAVPPTVLDGTGHMGMLSLAERPDLTRPMENPFLARSHAQLYAGGKDAVLSRGCSHGHRQAHGSRLPC